MNKRFFFLILPALLLSACASDSTSGTAGGKVTASIESMTRTQLLPEEDVYKVLWMAGDRIAVSGTATAYYTADQGGSSASAFSPVATTNHRETYSVSSTLGPTVLTRQNPTT